LNNQVKVEIDDTLDRSELFGIMDRNLKIIKDNFSVEIIQRGNEITLTGDDAEKAGTVIREMLGIIASGEKNRFSENKLYNDIGGKRSIISGK